jgi:hypothetical protein
MHSIYNIFPWIFLSSISHILRNSNCYAMSEEEKDESQIAGAPSELRVHPGHDFVQISWLPPMDNNVVIRGYQV